MLLSYKATYFWIGCKKMWIKALFVLSPKHCCIVVYTSQFLPIYKVYSIEDLLQQLILRLNESTNWLHGCDWWVFFSLRNYRLDIFLTRYRNLRCLLGFLEEEIIGVIPHLLIKQNPRVAFYERIWLNLKILIIH